MRNTSRILLSLLALLLLMAACVPIISEETGAEPQQQRLHVIIMGNVIANHIYNVAGDHVAIIQLVAQGIDPHHFEPTPSDVVKLAEADIVFIRGAARPEAVRARLATIVGDENKIVLLAPLVIDPDEYIYDDFGVIDLHMGGDPIFVSRFAEVIRDTLVDRDPDNAAAYQANYDEYAARIEELDAAIRGGRRQHTGGKPPAIQLTQLIRLFRASLWLHSTGLDSAARFLRAVRAGRGGSH